MLSILLPVDNPPLESDRNGIATLILDIDESYGAIVDYQRFNPSESLSEEIILPDLVSNGFIYFPLPEKAGNIVSVTIDGKKYEHGSNPLLVGQFTVDATGIVVRIDESYNNLSIVTIQYQSNNLNVIASNVICNHPAISLFAQRNIGYADITISESLGEPPTLSAIAFTVCKNDIPDVQNSIYIGLEFFAFGHKWIVNRVNINYVKSSEQAVIGIDSAHWSMSRGNPSICSLDKKIKLKQSNYDSRPKIGYFAAQAAIDYKGADFSISVPRTTGSEDVTTVRELLDRLITKHHVVNYTSDRIESFEWGSTPLVAIAESDVLSDIIISLNGHGKELDGVKLHTEYRNVKVNMDFDIEDEKTGVTTRWAYENCRDFSDLVSAAEYRGFYYEQPDPEVLRNPGINFDNGGAVKKATKITELNGTVTSEETWEYGYAFTSNETHEIITTAQGNFIIKLRTILIPDTYWKETLHTTTRHVYDKDGYLIKSITTGKQLARLQQESEKLESVILQAKANQAGQNAGGIFTPDPSLQAQSDAYKFDKSLPIEDVTDYTLESHAKYFDDTVKHGDRCQSDFVEPKFVKSKTRVSKSYIVADNPKNNETFTYPQIVSGKFLTESEETVITNKHFPYKFETRVSSQNSEGEYAKNAIALGSVTQNIGKPGIATRIDKEIDRFKVKNWNYELYRNSNYYLNPEHPVVQENSKGYPDIDSPFEVLAIADTELSIINTQNAMTVSFELKFRDDLRVGDRILFQNQIWVLLNKNDTRKLSEKFSSSSKLEVTLGRLLKPKLKLIDKTFC